MERGKPTYYCVDTQLNNRVQEYISSSKQPSVHLDDVVAYLVQKFPAYKRKPQVAFRKTVASSTDDVLFVLTLQFSPILCNQDTVLSRDSLFFSHPRSSESESVSQDTSKPMMTVTDTNMANAALRNTYKKHAATTNSAPNSRSSSPAPERRYVLHFH